MAEYTTLDYQKEYRVVFFLIPAGEWPPTAKTGKNGQREGT
jgi:hypothetical protein